VMALLAHNHISEASRLASEHVLLLESIGDPSLTVGLSFAATASKHEAGEMAGVLRLSQRVIDLADGDPSMGNLFIGSPLALATTWRGAARWCLGIPGWRDDLAKGVAIARTMDPISHIITVVFHYVVAIPNGVLPADATALRDTAEALEIAERSGDDVALDLARAARGVALVNQTGPQREPTPSPWPVRASTRTLSRSRMGRCCPMRPPCVTPPTHWRAQSSPVTISR
jgi:adenylate cyclase